MPNYQYNREARLLLVDHYDEKVAVQYNSNQQPILMPQIGPRPPYYCHPRYEQYYPVI